MDENLSIEENNSKNMILCENLVKIYKTKDIEVVALQGLDLTVEKGELMAIIGNSGSGKSTLLNMLGGLDRPSAGKLLVDDIDLLKLNDSQLVKYKRETVGFVWQNNARNLVPYLTAVENVELPMLLTNTINKKQRAIDILDMVGLSHRRDNKLSQLSGGEQQRVAISIAIANNPKMLLADEPTGAVDTKTSNMILDIFGELNRNLGLTVVIVTHDRQLSKKVDRVVAIRDGRTSSEILRRKSYLEEIQEIGAEASATAANTDETHVELAVLDRAGRLQIPKEYLQAMGLTGKDKIHVIMENDKVVLVNPEKEAINS